MLGRMIEHSSYPLHVTTPGGSSVIITCSDFATELYFGELEVSNHIDEETPPTMKKLERNYPFAESATSGGESKNATMEKVTSPLGSDTDDNRFASKSDFTKTLNSTGLALNENHVSVYHYNQVEGKKNGSPLVTNTTSLPMGKEELKSENPAENSPQMMKRKASLSIWTGQMANFKNRESRIRNERGVCVVPLSKKEKEREELQQFLKRGAPFSALKIHDLQKVDLPPNLPISHQMKKAAFDYTTNGHLKNFDFNKLQITPNLENGPSIKRPFQLCPSVSHVDLKRTTGSSVLSAATSESKLVSIT
ncbi:uncharacterized protein LOC143236185 [Tachypleus tridentatus]|uniref:uncharacterized protein LOC143236185 n=1 Tax=Tachypleus tridentatus TaxID=6853 RepID=UPI003FD3CC8A